MMESEAVDCGFLSLQCIMECYSLTPSISQNHPRRMVEKMDLIDIRHNAVDIMRFNLGIIDVIAWLPREKFQGYLDAIVRVIPERMPRVFRVFDGGDFEEITESIDPENYLVICESLESQNG